MVGKYFRAIVFSTALGLGYAQHANADVVEIALQGVVASKLISQFEDAASIKK